MLAPLFLLFAPVLPLQQPEPRFAWVGEKPAPVHAWFADSTALLATLTPGLPVKVVETRTPWARIQVPGGFAVWVHGDFVAREGNAGRISHRFVRARPLPSDGAESYPVGKFQKDDPVEILGQEGPWLRVRAPEHLGGWVRTSFLILEEGETAAWTKEWAAERLTRKDSPPPGAAVPKPAPPPEKTKAAPALEAPSAIKAAPSEGEADSPAPQAASAVLTESGVEEALLQAEVALGKMASAGEWDPATAGELETTLGAVRWVSSDSRQIARAREALARLEALRHAEQLKEQMAAAKKALDSEAAAAEAAARHKALEAVTAEPSSPLDAYDSVGWVEYRPALEASAPFVLVQGARIQHLVSPGGRFDLKDFLGREVAVRGSFEPDPVAGGKTLLIAELRVLPQR